MRASPLPGGREYTLDLLLRVTHGASKGARVVSPTPLPHTLCRPPLPPSHAGYFPFFSHVSHLVTHTPLSRCHSCSSCPPLHVTLHSCDCVCHREQQGVAAVMVVAMGVGVVSHLVSSPPEVLCQLLLCRVLPQTGHKQSAGAGGRKPLPLPVSLGPAACCCRCGLLIGTLRACCSTILCAYGLLRAALTVITA